MNELTQKHCRACEGGTQPMDQTEAQKMLEQVPGWELLEKSIEKSFKFDDFYQTIAFVNAVAWIANQEDHHPDLLVGYNKCRITYSTHAIGGLSENDFISAAKVNELLQ